MKPLIFLNSHPIQYFAPLYKEIVDSSDINLEVWYCSDESIRGKLDKGFGKKVKWNIPLLEGYKYAFIRNYSLIPSVSKGFFGLMNFGVIRKLYKAPKSVVVIHGWSYFTHVATIIFAKITGHRVCLRAETPLNQEQQKNKILTAAKNLYLKIIFSFVDSFLYIGHQNFLFYKQMKVDDKDLYWAPYCVDNRRFRNFYNSITRREARNELKLPAGKKIILYSGKYITKKRPLDLLQAFNLLNDESAMLIFVGDGELRPALEQYINEHRLRERVVLTGFVNQNEIPLYYRSADLFVMCSGVGETWGLAVNEAMNFGLPVIVSDTCGCAYDLVDDTNGAVFETGNIQQLADLLKKHLYLSENEAGAVEKASFNIIERYSYKQVIDSLKILVK